MHLRNNFKIKKSLFLTIFISLFLSGCLAKIPEPPAQPIIEIGLLNISSEMEISCKDRYYVMANADYGITGGVSGVFTSEGYTYSVIDIKKFLKNEGLFKDRFGRDINEVQIKSSENYFFMSEGRYLEIYFQQSSDEMLFVTCGKYGIIDLEP